MSDDGPPLTLDQVRAAAAVGRLPDLAHQLVAEHRWSSLEVLLTMTATPGIPLPDVIAALQAVVDAQAQLTDSDRREALGELREVELHAANALARRCGSPPLTDRQRAGLRAAASLLAGLGETRRAAEQFEKIGDEARAAEAWGELGELERMEACLARDEQQRQRRLDVVDRRRRFELLVAAGDRLGATALVQDLPPQDLDSQELVARGRTLEGRLCRGRSVGLRLPDGRLVRVAGLPAVLGREPTVELPLREPTVSRRHARLSLAAPTGSDGKPPIPEVLIEDAGSRGGTWLGGLRLAGALPLHGQGELALGASSRLRYRVAAPGAVVLEGGEGLDRDLLAVVAADPVDLGALLGLGRPARVSFARGVARLELPDATSLRAGDHLVGPACDLLHGERLETSDGRRFEVL